MKVILYMAMSLNGMIARENYEEDFISDYDWDVFCKLANKIGCFIIGRKTYEIITTSKDYNLDEVKNASKIIISKNKSFKNQNKFIFVKSPKEALEIVKTLGFKTVLLAGGGNTNSEFMKSNLVDEIFFNVDPVLVGEGIRVFKESTFENKLEFLGMKKLKHGIIQLHYRVK